ncbi:acetyl/propionyl/methylcrotonyl-CoA carboxylase subunit alpha [Rhodococcus jostii]|uniref:acetyl/propionyl/methylcrotonyl-CoA carboxylase subunit alpha n=1 Tax=Rhodococcus jostii TaxID=132919 RepID=UPI00364D3766
MTDEPPRPLRKVLVANRGEIAVRVIRAAREAGLASVAVYARPDSEAPHVHAADEAVALDGTTAAETYLRADALIEAARTTGADAVHPGYGFLSENADFAEAVQSAGLVWIGPDPAAIRTLGNKVAARAVAVAVGAPLAAGTAEPVRDAAEVISFAEEHGLPIAIKAAFGGGGRGLKIARTLAEIPDLLDSARREAAAAFGRDECFVERYLERARHVEAQVLADGHGTVMVVGTRDCTLQRRHQKLVEEAPAPFLTPEQDAAIRSSAEDVCRRTGYVNAGTVEYLVGGDGTVSFLEVNTRLQVEHPVTEESSGIDLVAEQFRIAGGARLLVDRLPVPQAHAFEFRINCEDPGQGFVPSPGTVTRYVVPTGPGVRFDSGIEAGTVVGGQFDSLLAKLVVFGRDRNEALSRARKALAETVIDGLPTLLPFHRAVVDDPAFAEDFVVHNGWVETEFDNRIPPFEKSVEATDDLDDLVPVWVGGRQMTVSMPGLRALGERGEQIRRAASAARAEHETAPGSTAVAPMQGTIVRVNVKDGDVVDAGDVIAVLEAMKMENPVLAPRAGTIREMSVAVGDSVSQGTTVCVVDDADSTT